jgi:hypothetical protein
MGTGALWNEVAGSDSWFVFNHAIGGCTRARRGTRTPTATGRARLADGDPAAVEHDGLPLCGLEVERDHHLPQQAPRVGTAAASAAALAGVHCDLEPREAARAEERRSGRVRCRTCVERGGERARAGLVVRRGREQQRRGSELVSQLVEKDPAVARRGGGMTACRDREKGALQAIKSKEPVTGYNSIHIITRRNPLLSEQE